MSESTARPARITTIVIGAAVAALLALTAAASLRGGAGDSTAAATSAAASSSVATDSASASTVPTPQPTTTAAITSPAPIVSDVTAAVTSMTAVKGVASQPGEIAGAAVRFAITLKNTTSHAIDLSNTVVNATAGSDADPAYPLTKPGGKAFPASVAAGQSVTGEFVFTIPESERGQVSVTVDTSTSNPVVAFTGSAPR